MAALLNSIAVAIFATLIAMALGVPAGYALARFKFRRVKNRDLTIWYLSQRVLPPVVVVIPFTSLKARTFPVYLAGAEDTRGVQFWFMATRAILALGPPVVLAVAIF